MVVNVRDDCAPSAQEAIGEFHALRSATRGSAPGPCSPLKRAGGNFNFSRRSGGVKKGDRII